MRTPSRFLAVSLATVIAAATACDGEDAKPPEDVPTAQCALDLNVDTTKAPTLTPGTAASGILCPAFDQDYFAFDVATAGTIATVSVSMSTRLSNLDPAYRIVREDGTPSGGPTPFSGEDPDSIPPTDFSTSHRLAEPGRYYVLVFDARSVDDGFDVLNPYSVTVDLVADPDGNEPNNDDDTATVVPVDGTATTGQIATSGDEDWYAIDAPAGAQIADVVVTANADSAVEHEALLVGPDGTSQLIGGLLDDDSVAGSLSRRLRVRVEGGARSYLVVRDSSGINADLGADASYSLEVTVLGNPDGNEGATGNDTAETATSVVTGTSLTAVLATTGDQDAYRIRGPGSVSASNPSVLIVEVDATGVSSSFRPQLTVLGVDPEQATNEQACVASCAACDQDRCKNPRLQRFIRGAGFRAAYPLRDTRDVIVVVNEFGDDAFQDPTYTIRFQVIDDPDPGEAGDDYLIPNLEFAGFSNGAQLAQQFDESIARARPLTTTFPTTLPIVDVPEPVPGIQEEFTTTVDCSAPGAADQTVTATGRLSYDGDRDYFSVDVPAEGYWGLDFRYSISGAATTPVELTMFVHTPAAVVANTLEAENTQGFCNITSLEDQGSVVGPVPCPAGSICVDQSCWSESTTNPTFSNQIFPQANECSFISVVDRGNRPVILEVTDNGVNDFDTSLTYTFELTIRCGCPTACNDDPNSNIERCQGVAAPN
jgi:hypothetical protein